MVGRTKSTPCGAHAMEPADADEEEATHKPLPLVEVEVLMSPPCVESGASGTYSPAKDRG